MRRQLVCAMQQQQYCMMPAWMLGGEVTADAIATGRHSDLHLAIQRLLLEIEWLGCSSGCCVTASVAGSDNCFTLQHLWVCSLQHAAGSWKHVCTCSHRWCACAAGLVCLELYKVLQNKAVEDYRNTFANLAIPLFAMSEPLPPKTFEFQPQGGDAMKWSLWDRWILKGDLTVQQTLDWFKVRSAHAMA